MMRLSPMRCSTKRMSHSWRTQVEEFFDVGVQYEVHAFAGDPDAQRVERVMRAPFGSKPVTEAEEIFLVDRIQHRRGRALDDLVLQRGDRQRSLSSVRLGYVDPPAGRRPICSPVDLAMQVHELARNVTSKTQRRCSFG